MTSVAASNRPSRTKWQRILALSIAGQGSGPLLRIEKLGKLHENEAGPVAAKRERKRVGD